MKHLSPLLTLIIGVIIGAWWPQSQLRVAEKNIETLEKELSKKRQTIQPVVTDVTKMLGVTSSSKPRRFDENKPVLPEKTPLPLSGQTPSADDEDIWNLENELNPEDFESPEEFLKEASDLWQARADVIRDAMIDTLNMTSSEISEFDRTMAEMNHAIEESSATFAESFRNRPEIGPEEGLRIVNGVSGILLNTYEKMDEFMPNGWRERAPEDAQPFNFIDPYSFHPMLALEDMMAP